MYIFLIRVERFKIANSGLYIFEMEPEDRDKPACTIIIAVSKEFSFFEVLMLVVYISAA
jgi:hypothetical protein